MFKKNHLLERTAIPLVIAIFLLATKSLVAEINPAELVNLLNQRDQIFSTAGYKISFTVATQDNQFRDPNQGMIFRDCEFTWPKEGVFAMKINNHYEHPPIFSKLGPKKYRTGDYDDKGNLIVWRTIEEYTLCTSDRNDTISKLRVFFVDPNNRIVQTGDNTMLYHWPIDKPYSMYQFKDYQFPTGRGFSRHLGAITLTKTLPSGLTKVNSKGSLAPGVPGTWELTMDPNSDWLVREATFTMEGQLEPTKVITSSGIIEKDGIKLARYGTYKYSNLVELSVEVADISKIVGPNKLYDEVLSRLNSPLPAGASVVDLRGEKHTMTNVE